MYISLIPNVIAPKLGHEFNKTRVLKIVFPTIPFGAISMLHLFFIAWSINTHWFSIF